MSLENVQEESAAEPSPAALRHRVHCAGGVPKQPRNVVAFKFGGSSLFGADRMLHAAGLVRAASQASSVTVVVSAMKGVTDHLLSIARALADAKLAHARRDVLLPLLQAGIVPVVTGFIGATPDGRITTLGRNSSDFSGAIIAHVVDADELVIWTDVDGIYTANPNECAEARLLHELSYDEAHALAASGAKVLHEKVLPLAAETEMVVWVRNTFNPQARGTRIGSPRSLQNSRTASRDSVSIFSISTEQSGAA